MLSTHVLDLVSGMPAAGLEVALYRLEGEARTLVERRATNADGRIDAPFGGELAAGRYELLFAAGEYFRRAAVVSFYEEIPVRFRLDPAAGRYHVPLLLAPWGYSTYRGS
jgi:5-hydroxyisourate hydrolase